MSGEHRSSYQALAVSALMLLMATSGAGGVGHASSNARLVLLTRSGCVNTTTMRTRLDEALRRLGITTGYVVVDAYTLKGSDKRRGYGTPTVLFNGRDVFGLPEPRPPLPSPT